TWSITDLNEDQVQQFSINTNLTDFNLLTFDYVVEVLQEGQGLCLNNQQACDLQVTTADAVDTAAQIVLPEVTLVPITPFPVCEGTPVVVDVEMEGDVDYADFDFDWNVVPISQNNNRFTFEIQDFIQLQVNVSPAGNDDENCGDGAVLDVEVYPGANINIVLVEGATCAGQSDARITVSINGELNTGYTEQEPFEIINASPLGDITMNQLVESGELIDVQDLPQGPFTIEFRDNYGCTFERTVNIPTIGSPIANFCTTLLPCGIPSGNVDMSFDTEDLHSELSGGSYDAVIWDNQNQSSVLEFQGMFPDNQSHTLANVSKGINYTLEITAANGCVYTRPFTIASYTVSATVTNDNNDPEFYELCFANETRDIVLGISDNIPVCSNFTVPGYEVWFGTVDENNAYENNPDIFMDVANEVVFEDLGVGNYKVIVKPLGAINYPDDIALCDEVLNFSITQRANFVVSLQSQDPLCAGEATGSAEVVING
ncbi:unnamed protein product, partial [Laminaria digitata]